MSTKRVSFLPSQIDAPVASRPLTATASPFSLLCADIVLFFTHITYTPGIILPLTPFSGPLDELYPSLANLWALFIHGILIVIQAGYVLSIFLAPFFIAAAIVAYSGTVVLVVSMFCYLLNSGKSGEIVYSDESILQGYEKHDDEVWVFVNGVAVGKHWLQNNVNRLSQTFRRPIIGVHNPTGGIIFDVIQCLIQRDLSYNTPDVRQTYAYLKHSLLDHQIKKVVLIAHSQGGIIASMALDWLYADIPLPALGKLEVYTFGCAANHFNNPLKLLTYIPRDGASHSLLDRVLHPDSPLAASTRAILSTLGSARREHEERVVSHIEHYANGNDFVARWGVLNYAKTHKHASNRFVGRVFEQVDAGGHQLNQHYLDTMFPIDPATGQLKETSAFMESLVDVDEDLVLGREKPAAETIDHTVGRYWEGKELSAKYLEATRAHAKSVAGVRVKDLSRLWLYRNGQVPDPIPPVSPTN